MRHRLEGFRSTAAVVATPQEQPGSPAVRSIDAGNSPNIYWSGYLSDIATSFVYDTPGIAHYQDEKGKHHIYVTGFTDGSDAFVTKIDQ